MTLEQKLAFLAISDPATRRAAFDKWAKEDKQFFLALNVNRVSMDQLMEQKSMQNEAKKFAEYKQSLQNKGWTHQKNQKLIGSIPAHIYYTRDEFNPRKVSPEQLKKNIKAFLDKYPAFKV